jgi:hypothetical protein
VALQGKEKYFLMIEDYLITIMNENVFFDPTDPA